MRVSALRDMEEERTVVQLVRRVQRSVAGSSLPTLAGHVRVRFSNGCLADVVPLVVAERWPKARPVRFISEVTLDVRSDVRAQHTAASHSLRLVSLEAVESRAYNEVTGDGVRVR